MKTKYYFLAALASITFASCSDDAFVGDNSPNVVQDESAGNAIVFASNSKGTTRGDIYGGEAARLLGQHFYVMGTKGTGEGAEVEPASTPTTSLVFDNYLVHYAVNTAGTTESNTANWEYVGVQPEATGYTNYVYLTSKDPVRTAAPQTIKYWDYSTDSYDFFAFSTGGNKAVSNTILTGDGALLAGEIGVTNMNYGTALTSGALAYTLYIPSVADLEKTYITDIKKVVKADYGKEVQLQFKNIGAKVRVGLYETVPGYSVKEVKFYTVDATATPSDLAGEHETNAYLIGSSVASEYSFPSKARIDVAFGHTGADNDDKQDYDKATATVTAAAKSNNYQSFGTLNYTGKDPNGHEAAGNYYLGRELPHPSFAGSAAAQYYKTVFPVSTSYPLTLRVDYTLVSTDGSGEEIHVYGAKAVVPSTYTKWLPNYAYTYIFKISDNTNGWTSTNASDPKGLFPITFDAVVTEATDVTGEQTTITTVSTPTITTYQQNHNPNKNGEFTPADEYSKATEKDIYVQVMDNNLSPAVLVGTGTSELPLLNAAKEEESPKYHASLLYKVSDANATEAMVMDALQNRKEIVRDYNTNVIGRNDITLTYDENINNAVTSIVNGVDNNEITSIPAGQAAMIDISQLTQGTYAYVYDYTWKATSTAWTTSTDYTAKQNTKVYQPIAVTNGEAVGSKITGTEKNSISVTALNSKTEASYFTTDVLGTGLGETVNSNDYVYFSKTENGSGTPTYSYVSVDGKTTVPAGLLKVPVSELENANSGTTADGTTFYFEIYVRNTGKYAVKVIKIKN